MFLRPLILAAAGAALLSACAAPAPPPKANEATFQPIATAGQFLDVVAGKPITFDNGGVLIANPDGSFAGDFSGETPEGSWAFSSGQLCRTVRIGAQQYPEVCNLLEVTETAVRFLNLDGTLSSEAKLG